MAYREVTMIEITEVLRQWLAGARRKQIARRLGLDPKTVRRYLRAGERCGLAPGLDAAHVLTHLRARMESVFVPRPLFVIEQLPRNAVGKLPLDMLLALLEQHRSA